MNRLEGRMAPATGVARGPGPAFALAFAREETGIAPAAVLPASDESFYDIGASLHPHGGDVMI